MIDPQLQANNWLKKLLKKDGLNTIAINLLFVHTEVVASVSHELVVLNEAAGIEQERDSLSSSQLVLCVLFIYSWDSTAEQSLLVDFVPPDHEFSLSGEAECRCPHQGLLAKLGP